MLTLHDRIYHFVFRITLFRVAGALIIVLGLYLIIWGKSKDSTLSDSRNDELGIVDLNPTQEKNHNEISKSEIVDGEASV